MKCKKDIDCVSMNKFISLRERFIRVSIQRDRLYSALQDAERALTIASGQDGVMVGMSLSKVREALRIAGGVK